MRNHILCTAIVTAAAATAGTTAAHAHRDPPCRRLIGPRLEALVNDRTSAAFAATFGPRDGLVPFFADDVIVLLPFQPIIRGKAAARAYYESVDPTGAQRLSWTPTRIDASVDDRMGTSWGTTATTTPADDGTTSTQLGKNIVVWRRQAGRPWRIAVYFQSNSAFTSVPPAGFGLFPDEPTRCAAPVDPVAETALLEQTDDDFAAESVAQDLAVAFRDFAAPDGAIRSGASVIVGPDAIFAADAPFVDPDETIDWSASDGDVAGSGDLGWTVGHVVDDIRDPGTPEDIGFSKYLTVWEKQPDGSWRYVIDGGNVEPAPAP